MTSSVSIETLRLLVPVAWPARRRQPAEVEDMHIEVHENQFHVWSMRDDLSREIFMFDLLTPVQRYVCQPLSALPHLDEVHRCATEHYLANRSNPVGAFLEPAVRALDATVAARDGASVYFAQADDRVKIGWSKKVATRLASLQTGNASPIRLLGTMPGARALERRLHEQFADLRLAGEWFRATPELLAFVAEEAQ